MIIVPTQTLPLTFIYFDNAIIQPRTVVQGFSSLFYREIKKIILELKRCPPIHFKRPVNFMVV